MKKYGIETIQKAMQVALDVAKGIHNGLDDGKIKFFEMVGIVGKTFGIAEVINRRQELLDEVRDLDEAEKTELYLWLQDRYNIPNNFVEKTVEESLNLFFQILDFSFSMAEVWKKS